jgi:hypothetical protein
VRATKLGRWARRAAVVLVLGFGAAALGAATAQAEVGWESPTPSAPAIVAPVGQGVVGAAAFAQEVGWE